MSVHDMSDLTGLGRLQGPATVTTTVTTAGTGMIVIPLDPPPEVFSSLDPPPEVFSSLIDNGHLVIRQSAR